MRAKLPLVVALGLTTGCAESLIMAPPPTLGTSESAGAAFVIVDGAVVPTADLNSADIEAVEVVKGPAATALYGAQCNMSIVVKTRPTPSVEVFYGTRSKP